MHKHILKFQILFFIFAFFFNYAAFANVVINNGLTHIHRVEGELIIKGKIEVQNTDDKAQAVKVYQTDYAFDYKGGVYYDKPGTNDRSNAKWIDFSPTYFELAPQEESVILYEIKVPEEAVLTGSYWSILMVEGQNVPTTNVSKNSLSINTIVRYAVQIITNIGESGERNLEFVEAKLGKAEGKLVSEISLVNTGERLLQPEIIIEMFNEDGESFGEIKAEKKKIFPGTSTKFILDLANFPKGEYQAVVLADCNEEDIFGLNLKLKINDE